MDLERRLIELWAESERRREKVMMTKKAQRAWVSERLACFANEKGLDVKEISNDGVMKNKIDGIRRKGKALVDKHIRPLVDKARKIPTGSAAPDDGPPSDPLADIDWDEFCRISKWPNFKVYWDCFGSHPTWGIWPTVETVSDDDERWRLTCGYIMSIIDAAS